MTKEERYAIWNRYYQKHKTEINARRKIVRESYKNKLSEAENKIVELEKENAELKAQLENDRDLPAIAYMQGAEKQKKKDEGQLTKAKEIIKLLLWDLRNRSYEPVKDIEQAEQFLSEVEK